MANLTAGERYMIPASSGVRGRSCQAAQSAAWGQQEEVEKGGRSLTKHETSTSGFLKRSKQECSKASPVNYNPLAGFCYARLELHGWFLFIPLVTG